MVAGGNGTLPKLVETNRNLMFRQQVRRMFKALRQMIAEFAGPTETSRGQPDERLAAAALLVHVIAVDGTITEEERAKLKGLFERRFGLSAEDAEALIVEARAADLEAVDLYGFTSILKTALDQPGRERVIGMMWEMVFADGEAHEFEENVVWRVAELLGVSTRDRVRLKQAARGQA